MSSDALWQLGPETLVALTAVVVYVAGAFGAPRVSWSWVGLAGLAAAAVCLGSIAPQTAEPLRIDALALWLRWFALGSGVLLVLMSWRPAADADGPELLGSLLVIVAGMMLAAAAGDLILLFLGLELISIPTYILLFVGRRSIEGREAAAKYFFLSILASAILLFGLSFLYGAAGTTSIETIHQRLLDGGGSLGGFAGLSLVFIFAGLSYRIAAVPFHFYAPDVYQGTTNENAALLSVAPKAAGFLALVRLVAVAAEGVSSDAWRIALALAVLTMTTGNLLALWQDNLRRLLAYSSIAHAGYMLIGLAVFLAGNTVAGAAFDGVAAMLFYLLIYALATMGTFAALNWLGEPGRPVDHIDQLAGLAWSDEPRGRMTAWLIAAFLFSLTGIPPLAGFWGKLALFAGALGVRGTEPATRAWFVGLAILGTVNAAIAAAYYLRIVGVMFFRMPLGKPTVGGRPSAPLAAAVICAFLVVAIGLIPTPWYEAADRAAPAVAARENPEAE